MLSDMIAKYRYSPLRVITRLAGPPGTSQGGPLEPWHFHTSPALAPIFLLYLAGLHFSLLTQGYFVLILDDICAKTAYPFDVLIKPI